METSILFEVFIFLAAACAVVPLVSRFKLGAVLGYLAAGIVIGPWGFGFITASEEVMHFGEFGVVMMLFVIGLELEPLKLWRLRSSILGLGSLQVVLTTLCLFLAGILLGFSWQVSVAAGMALALSSTALVLQMLNERNLMHTEVGQTSFSVLLFQDIAVIPILVLMPLLAMPDQSSELVQTSVIAELPGYVQTLIVAAVIALVIFGGRFLSHHLFSAIARTNLREIFTALSLALIVGITLLMQLVGVSPALGAFVAGVVLANSEYRHTLETDLEPFKGLLLGLFFISVGMGIDFGLLVDAPLRILIAVTGLMAIKAGVLWLLGRQFNLTSLYNLGFALALCQGGEFAFVLFQFAGGLNILQPEQAQFLTLVVALSIAATPFVMLGFNHFIVPRFMSNLPEPKYDTITEQHPIILAGFGRFGQVIGRFLIGQGIKLTVLEKDATQIELLRKFGFKAHFGDATRLDLLRNAGAATARLLIVAVDDATSSLRIVEMAKREFPGLTLFVRARNRQHAYELHKLGVPYFKREMFDSSLIMARDVMLWLGYNEQEVNSKAEKFRNHDHTTLRESFQYYEDESS
ncbi:MAG: monovalent cation:proton antiporter-2 (CPA2) family protein, partial [Pseudomonadota bacterium]